MEQTNETIAYHFTHHRDISSRLIVAADLLKSGQILASSELTKL